MTRTRLVCLALVVMAAWPRATATAPSAAAPLPVSSLWLVPATPAGASDFATAVKAIADGAPYVAVPLLQKHVGDPVLGGHALLYLGRAELAAKSVADAQATAETLLQRNPDGILRENALLLAADIAMAADQPGRAVRHLQDLLALKPQAAEHVWLALGQAAEKAHDRALATEAFRHVYFSFPLAPESDDAAKALTALTGTPVAPTADTFTLSLNRAQQLYGAHKYADAKSAFTALRALAIGADGAMVDLRVAEIDVNLKKFQAGFAALEPFLDNAKYSAEARYWRLVALRGLKKDDDFIAGVHAFVADAPASAWADDALNDLASDFIVQNDDAKAAEVFAEYYERFPHGANAERAAWKAGWWAYKTGRYAETIRMFDDAATKMPHADTRPAWLYWSARAHARLDEQAAAIAGYRRTIEVYCHTYYGREAARELAALAATHVGGAPVAHVLAPLSPGAPPANAAFIAALLSAGLYDDAIAEVREIERKSSATPILDATLAYAYQGKSDLRAGYQLMKRAYPQYLTAGGDQLPIEIQKVIYPVAYWDVIYKDATAQKLDPYLMAALINTESTFQADAKSGANAWGLMQIVPGTGREYAAKLGIRPFSPSRLNDPAVNARIGMAYFADLVKQFGTVHAALASYNAGENRAARWIAERPGIARDEFIDDIPFPETQGYVKRIISLAEDYRRVYPGAAVVASAAAKTTGAAPKPPAATIGRGGGSGPTPGAGG